MKVTRTATARYQGLGKEGQGQLTTQSGILDNERYGFGTRFGDEKGTNPEELIAAAHAGCFTMALSLALAREGIANGTLETKAEVTIEQQGEAFTITRSDLELTADVPGIDEGRLRRLAEDAKANCPVSKLFKADMELTVRTGATATA
ncbi:MAG TPA: OsmC family protein [Sphingomicrobium sp.]